jgi:hypothetical protein
MILERKVTIRRAFLFAVILCTASLSPLALADPVDVTLIGVGTHGHLGGVYIGPYVARIDGVETEIVCNDFTATTYLGESWQANVHSFSNLTGTKFYDGSNAQSYFQAAWLSMQLMQPNVTCASGVNCYGAIQYAIWEVFAPGTIEPRLSDPTEEAALALLADAQSRTYTADQFAGWSVLTAIPGTARDRWGNLLSGNTPQEFIVRTPEPSLAGLLGTNLFLLAGAVLLRRRGARQL